jgi:DNA-binding beta-propeller fold protein YncE
LTDGGRASEGRADRVEAPLIVTRAWLLVALACAAALARADDVPLAPGEIVIADNGGRGFAGALHRLPAGGVPRPIATTEPLAIPTAVVIDRDGTLVVGEIRRDAPGRIIRVDPRSGAVDVLADGWPLLTPMGLAIDERGDVLVADLDAGSRLDFPRGSLAGSGAVYRLPRGGTPMLLSQDCCRWNASGLAVTPSGALAVVDMGFQVFEGEGSLTLVDAMTGVQRTIATDRMLLDPAGIVAGGSGTLYLTDATNPQPGPGAILAVEPATGTTVALSTGAPITDPRGIALTADGDLVVADSAAGAVYRIALPERDFTVLAQGDPLVRPFGIAVAR